MVKEKEPMLQSGKMTDQQDKGLYGTDPEMCLLSVSFATTENPYINEHVQVDSKDVAEQE